MGKITGFMEIDRHDPRLSPGRGAPEALARVRGAAGRPGRGQEPGLRAAWTAASPYCHKRLPGGTTRSPTWNDLVYRDQWKTAAQNLHSTNNFPEVTGRVCPAPCEGLLHAQTSTIHPVTIKTIECAIADKAFAEGWIAP